ncbi:MAG: LytR/AlgR family response regulator transcription factor [Acidobacteriota bacterium]
MIMRVVIVDDERPARDRLKRLLARHPDCVLVGEAADAVSAVELIDRQRPDLCFLDVRIPEGDGFEVLRRARHRPRVIFTTAYDRYAVPAFEVNSLDYLLKPFGRERFAAAIAKAREALEGAAPAGGKIVRLLEEIRAGLPRPEDAARAGPGPPLRIPARRGAHVVLIEPAEILWIEAEETVVFARTATARLLVDQTLGDLEARLAPGFFRAHRRFLINLSHVGEIRQQRGGGHLIVMRDADRSVLPLSRRRARLLREIIPW